MFQKGLKGFGETFLKSFPQKLPSQPPNMHTAIDDQGLTGGIAEGTVAKGEDGFGDIVGKAKFFKSQNMP